MSLLLTAIIATVSGFLGGLAKSFISRRSRSDDALLEKRRAIYAELWQFTGVLPLYPRDDTLTYATLASCNANLRDWYYRNAGGLFLSRATHQHYVEFQQALAKTIASGASQRGKDDRVSPDDYEAARRAGSLLRTSLTNDLNSRQNWRTV